MCDEKKMCMLENRYAFVHQEKKVNNCLNS